MSMELARELVLNASSEDKTSGVIIEYLLLVEGWPQYVNNPNDLGGPTKGGITLEVLSDYRGVLCTEQDLRDLKELEARQIYYHRYIEKPEYYQIEYTGLRIHVVDCAVLHGPSRATRWVQEIVGSKTDGIFGPKTAELVNAQVWWWLSIRLAIRRQIFASNIIESNYRQRRSRLTTRDQSMWAEGWSRRIMNFVEAANNAALSSHQLYGRMSNRMSIGDNQ